MISVTWSFFLDLSHFYQNSSDKKYPHSVHYQSVFGLKPNWDIPNQGEKKHTMYKAALKSESKVEYHDKKSQKVLIENKENTHLQQSCIYNQQQDLEDYK